MSPDPAAPTGALPSKIPRHIAIIMDGNGRWAAARGLPRLAGHRAGTENLRRVIRACVEFGIQVLTSTPSPPRTGDDRRKRWKV